MRILNEETALVGVETLRPHPLNPNQGDLGAIFESIEENGFFGSVVVQKSTNTILVGHHRWAAAREAGATDIPVTFVDVDDATAKKILLVDNRTARLGTDDQTKLAEILADLANTVGLEGSGYDGSDLDDIINDLANPLRPTSPANDPNAEWGGMPECENGEDPPFRTLNVHFGSAEAVADFIERIGQEFSDLAKYIWHPKQKMGKPSATPYADGP